MHTQVQVERAYEQPRHAVFECLVAADTLPAICKKYGPIAAIVNAAMVDDAELAQGAHRRVHMSDGVVLDEEIVAFERPRTHGYAWRGGLKFPFSWVVRGAHGHWDFDEVGEGTRVR